MRNRWGQGLMEFNTCTLEWRIWLADSHITSSWLVSDLFWLYIVIVDLGASLWPLLSLAFPLIYCALMWLYHRHALGQTGIVNGFTLLCAPVPSQEIKTVTGRRIPQRWSSSLKLGQFSEPASQTSELPHGKRHWCVWLSPNLCALVMCK